MELFPSPIVYKAIPPPSPGLPAMPKPLDLGRPTHWVGDDGANCFIEVAGNFAAVAFRRGPLSKPRPERQEIRGFSAASRLRLFKLTNQIDYESAGRCTFVTATWRDELGVPNSADVTYARSRFQRAMERIAGKEMPGLWRVEWKERRSGRWKGRLLPHVHVIYFKAGFLPVRQVGDAWAKALGFRGRVSVKMNEITSLHMCLMYVSKYLAKVAAERNLDIASYLNTSPGGRHWGIFRKPLLPMSETVLVRVKPGPLVESIRKLATEAYSRTPQDTEAGFCVFGEAAKRIRELVDEYCLTSTEGSVH